ncbi:TadE/TadG family type IV pilus assembly protein [Acidocella sp.]|jgi:Flp pilus assembly protein TadG|uniref:TadE/TadG family type IV pilus assembly protein n=1 Tax=Acidocella sp. TaxID=50710 RepID=UPI002F41CE97
MKIAHFTLPILKDRRSIAAVEFALVMPILLVLFIGTIEILTLYRTEAKLNAMTINVAQMVAVQNQATTNGISSVPATGTSEASLQNICQGALLGLAPFPGSGMTLKIAGVTLESSPQGAPTTSKAYSTGRSYDVWEGDFSVSGSSCSATSSSSTSAIGASNAETLATTSPPSTSGTVGTAGLLAVPCDNAIIVQASLTYPGILGVILHSRPTFTQAAYTRWRYAGTQEELQCSGTACFASNATTQVCNNTNTAN